jgi:hypothetical protein
MVKKWVDEPGNKEIRRKQLTTEITNLEKKIAGFPGIEFPGEKAKILKLKLLLDKLQ